MPPAAGLAPVALLARRRADAENASTVLCEAVAQMRASAKAKVVEPGRVRDGVGRGEGGQIERRRLREDLMQISSER